MEQFPSDQVVTAWARLLRAHTTALNCVETALKRAGLPPLQWYDILLELERADRVLRPIELESRTLLPQYGLSRLLDRMAAKGLVERQVCPTDRRGQYIYLTKAGRQLRRQIWPIYAAAIQQAVGDHLSDVQASELSELLDRISGSTVK